MSSEDATIYTIRLLEKHVQLLSAILEKINEQGAMLHAYIQNQTAHARASGQWKKDNPEDSEKYGEAAKRLQGLVFKYFDDMCEDLETLEDDEYPDFQVSEFAMKYGPNIVQMQSALQMLSNLGTQ